MSLDPFKDVLYSINESKISVVSNENENEYNSFLTNKSLSLFQDTIFFANEMNKHWELDNKLQYEFFLYSIIKKKRFKKWPKKENQEDIDIIKQYFNYSTKKAKETINILTNEQLTEIKKSMEEI